MSDLDSQKHVFFFVPNHDKSNTSDENGSPLSYVKLGSAKEHAYLASAAKRGDDLLAAAGLSSSSHTTFFADDRRGSACSVPTEESSLFTQPDHHEAVHQQAACLDASLSAAGTTYFKSTQNGVYTSDLARTGLSAELLGDGVSVSPRGGFRDHTDGNRIVTVRGDRVDLVVGNYKRVVFGRVSGDHVGPTAYDASGGHVIERTSTDVVQQYAVEHVLDDKANGDESWKVVERADNGDAVIRYSGKLREDHNGPLRKTTIGVDAEDATKNPEISRELRWTSIDRDVQADSFERSTEVDTLTDATWGAGARGSEQSFCLSYLKRRGKTSQRSFDFKEELRASVVVDNDFFVARAKVSSGGAQFDERGSHYKVIVGYNVDVHAGVALKLIYGSRTRMVGANWVRQCLLGSLSIDVGVYTEFSLMTLHSAPAKGQYLVGDLQVNYVKSQKNIASTKAQTMLMEL